MRASSSVRSLWERTQGLAKLERKTPILCLFSKSKPGGLVVVHQDDLQAAIVQWLVMQPDEVLLDIERDVRVARHPEEYEPLSDVDRF